VLCLRFLNISDIEGIFFQYALWYFAAISVLAVAVTVYDKRSAKSGGRRVRELTLLLIAVLGGSLFMYVTMHLIRHKTRHILFMAGIPLIMAVQAIIAVLLYAVQ
jgi:uncharacterized membrane protein YsdA (DUF1294 family)